MDQREEDLGSCPRKMESSRTRISLLRFAGELASKVRKPSNQLSQNCLSQRNKQDKPAHLPRSVGAARSRDGRSCPMGALARPRTPKDPRSLPFGSDVEPAARLV